MLPSKKTHEKNNNELWSTLYAFKNADNNMVVEFVANGQAFNVATCDLG